jgi:hypothetical protein
MRILPLLVLFLAACPDTSGVSCPPNTTTIGQYALAFDAGHGSGECIATPTDGATPTPLALDDAGTKGATFCAATGPDGGTQLQLLIPNKGGVRTSDLLPDGGFHFVSDPVVAQGTACVCDVNDVETLDGFLLTSAPFALLPDGGFPPVNAVSATLVDQLSNAAPGNPDAGCICALPCPVTYFLHGTLF